MPIGNFTVMRGVNTYRVAYMKTVSSPSWTAHFNSLQGISLLRHSFLLCASLTKVLPPRLVISSTHLAIGLHTLRLPSLGHHLVRDLLRLPSPLTRDKI